MITAGRDLYDDPHFFEGYRRLKDSGAGINEAVEIPPMSRMLPPLAGAAVVDLGCGAGALARRLADAGAANVVAVDSSQQMLALAAPHPRVRYLRADLDELTLPARSRRPGRQQPGAALRRRLPGAGPARHALAAAGWTVRPLDRTPHLHGRRSDDRMAENRRGHGMGGRRLAAEGPRTQNWIIEGVEKHHRQVATLIGGLLSAGLELTGIDEPVPGPATLQRHPHLAEHLRRPPLLVLGTRRGHVDPASREE
ncbi:class I SAM-dependent methyltransferase [Nonomuraea sp. CA-143628]|uniref:class I SAM-dependent methyltransferase n=1 Tax=Nonomuraea sp. CA-143628 TaxID=3239997 RepID=UPI003D8B5AFA